MNLFKMRYLMLKILWVAM